MKVRVAKKVLSRPEAYPPHTVNRAHRIAARRGRIPAPEGTAAPAAPAPAEPEPVEETAGAEG
ncbi:MAG: hypothetical protein AAF211_33710 [Myxococcota bacterium]